VRFTGLWRHANFMKLWIGQTVSEFGDQVTALALPLVAILTLHATAVQMGILVAVERAPFLALSLFAGVWIDRYSPRPTLILADFGRALFLGSVPFAAWLGLLRIEYLYAVALLVGTLTVFFDIAYYSFLPAIVEREQLVEGNARLSVTDSIASVAGPGVAGFLVQLLSATTAVLVDAVSFLVSVTSLLLIRVPRVAVKEERERQGMWREIADGLNVVLQSPLLRPLTACGATHNFTANMLYALFVLYLSRQLHLSPATIGLVFAAGSVGSLLGSLIGGRVGAWLGVGPTIGGMQLMTALGGVFFPLAGGPTWLAVALVITGQTLWGAARPIYNITQVSLRQAITPDHLLGRMTASMRFITWGVTPIGALAGGLLGASIGIRPTLVIVVAGETLAGLWVVFSPLWRVKVVPSADEAVTVG
jgi:MFS family permease